MEVGCGQAGIAHRIEQYFLFPVELKSVLTSARVEATLTRRYIFASNSPRVELALKNLLSFAEYSGAIEVDEQQRRDRIGVANKSHRAATFLRQEIQDMRRLQSRLFEFGLSQSR